MSNLSDLAKARLEELRIEYVEAKEAKDQERMSQLKYMAKSIKSAKATFVYPDPLSKRE